MNNIKACANKEYIKFYSQISYCINERRKELGKSLKELELITGLSGPSISRVTTVFYKPRLDTLYRILDALDLELRIVRRNKPKEISIECVNGLLEGFNNTMEFRVWVKKNDVIEMIRVKAESKAQTKMVVKEVNPDWRICAIEKII